MFPSIVIYFRTFQADQPILLDTGPSEHGLTNRIGSPTGVLIPELPRMGSPDVTANWFAEYYHELVRRILPRTGSPDIAANGSAGCTPNYAGAYVTRIDRVAPIVLETSPPITIPAYLTFANRKEKHTSAPGQRWRQRNQQFPGGPKVDNSRVFRNVSLTFFPQFGQSTHPRTRKNSGAIFRSIAGQVAYSDQVPGRHPIALDS